MFFFYHPSQTAENANYYKGLLFESVLRRYLTALGFKVELRQKHHSLEYDLDGTAELDGRRLIGEAKAHGRSITGETFSSFIGKVFPMHAKGAPLTALFLSTSSLTPDATDYTNSLEETGLKVRVITGDLLLDSIADKLGLPAAATLDEVVRSLGAYPLSRHMLVTEEGPLLLQLAAGEGGATPAAFLLLRADGQVIADQAFLADVRRRVADLQELTPLYPSPQPRQRHSLRDPIPEGLIVGNDWADYRLPAPPQFFVGRSAIAERIIASLLNSKSAGVVQLKSRSGVGKSSLTSFVSNQLKAQGVFAQVYDARNIKSVFDLWSVVQRFTGSDRAASDFGDMERQIALAGDGRGSPSVLLFDQFESTLADPDLFSGFEMLALACVRLRASVRILLARKNDLLTTYDDAQISLERLNEVSESIELDDFTAPEAVELIGKISEAADRPVSPEIKAYVLEFAQGFPWLLKRTMAHVLKLLQRGESRVEIASAALRLNDLFDEELEELDEVERDYLGRVAQRLPATYHQLATVFEEDPFLPRILDKLTRERLVRLNGSTYDTYSDVFKEYLVFRKLPGLRVAFAYRFGDLPVVSTFRKLVALRRFSTDRMRAELRKPLGSTFNLIRELRGVGLLDRAGSEWVIPDAALDAYDRSRLGEYLRQQLVKNALVSDLLGHLQSVEELPVSDLPKYLRYRFPFVEAADETWRSYAQALLAWLTAVQLVHTSKGTITLSKEDRGEVAQRLGNLRDRLRRVRGKSAPVAFLPRGWWRHASVVIEMLEARSSAKLSLKQHAALRDLIELNLATEDRQLAVASADAAKEALRHVLTKEPYASYWRSLEAGEDPATSLATIFRVDGVKRLTLVWRAKILQSWGLGSKVLERRYRITSEPALAVQTTIAMVPTSATS